MIPVAHVIAWSAGHPWPDQAQVEQDLLLSRAICAIAAHPYLGSELVFRDDMARLAITTPSGYRVEDAAGLVIAKLLSRVDG
ncbi:MAG: hypothetical protein LBQ92_02945 [Propionibacteriaceae bacterium]|jgi:hypothetical protein|nr:hypothetical protein [Propionibacteriaceae bacterium]